MSEAEIVDLGADPAEERRAARRRVKRVLAPIAAAALLVLSVIGLVVAGYENNRRGALALSGEVLEGLERRIALRAANWLVPAERSLRLLHGVYGGERLEQATREDAISLSFNLLRTVPSIALVSLADPNGNYVLQRRNAEGGIDTKTIQETPGPRRVTWVRRDRDGRVVATEDDPEDRFDPRTRPWYIAAVDAPGLVWTEPYIFFTDRAPGMTAAVAFRQDGALRGVFGVDIRLDDLSAFLQRLEIGRTGRAIIVDRSGRIVAYPDARRAVSERDGTLVRPRLDELGDPVLARAYDLHRVNGHGRFTFPLGDTSHIAIWAPLDEVGDGSWSMLITVPEEELVGFVTRASLLTSGVGAVVIAVALGLAALLIRQGLRADRMERALERRTQAMAAQAQALARLGRSPAVLDPTRDEGLELLTATLCDTLRARRASFWRGLAQGDTLLCEDIYDAASGNHARGQRMRRQAQPMLFSALARGDSFEAADAAADPRTSELRAALLADTAAKSVLVVPAMRGPALIGALIVEDRDAGMIPLAHATSFALAIAGIATARMTAAETARRSAQALAAGAEPRAAAGGGAPAPRLAPPSALRSLPAAEPLPERLSPALAARARQDLAAEVFPSVTVMLLRLTDPACLAEPVASAGGCALADEVVRVVQEAAEAANIAYLRVMGDVVIAADGFGDRADAAAEAVPAFALEVAERCAELFASLERANAFRIGIDHGTAIGSPVGRGARSYNIWGEALRGAEAMAASAPAGAVQVTEAVHARLRSAFIFRPRGRFWVPGVGETSTFLLAGRA
jgi:adenylate cyclase